jgi:hypothetical protein
LALVTARLDARVQAPPADLAEVEIAADHLHFFDLRTVRAIH